MSVALCVIHKKYGGHTWSNTHAVQIGATASGMPTPVDLSNIGAGQAITDANTTTNPPNFLAALLAFERLLHYGDVQFTDLYITDGRRPQATGETNIYFTQTLGFAGLSSEGGVPAPHTVAAALMAGSITWLIHRNIVGMGHKPGRMFVRGAISENAVSMNGPTLVAWDPAANGPAYQTYLQGTAMPMLAPYLFGGAQAATAQYSVPIYAPKKNTPVGWKAGELMSTIPVISFDSVGPVSRQVKRGKRRKATV